MVFTIESFSLKKKCDTGPTSKGCAVTSITELATDVNFREVIHKAKCAARISPIPTIINNVERGSSLSSSLVFFRNTTNGRMSNVVNNNRYNAMERGCVSSNDTINIAANETDTTDMKSAIYGLFSMKLIITS